MTNKKQYSDHTQKNELLAAVMKLQAEKRQLVEALQAMLAVRVKQAGAYGNKSVGKDIQQAHAALQKAGAQ